MNTAGKRISQSMLAAKNNKFAVIIELIVFSVIIISASYSYGEGNPIPYHQVSYNFYNMHFINSQNGWMCGKSGFLFQTKDGGLNWEKLETGFDNSIFGVFRLNEKHGIVVGQEGLVAVTNDSGQSWRVQKVPLKESFLELDFFDEQHGMAAGDWGKIIATEDGGLSWNDVSLQEDVVLYGVKCTGPKEVWIAGEMGNIFHTVDAGLTWDKKTLTEGTLFDIDFNDSGYGMAVGLGGTVLFTKDRGESWETSQLCKEALYNVRLNEDIALAVGDAGSIFTMNLKTDTSWRQVDVPNNLKANWLRCIEVINTQRFIIAGARGSINFIEGNLLLQPDM